MTELIDRMNLDHFERPALNYQLTPGILSGVSKGLSSRQLVHGNDYPVEAFTPGGVALTAANLFASLEAAVAYAQGVKGGNIIIPRGSWALALSDSLVVEGAGRDKNVTIVGAGGMDKTQLVLPQGYSGTLFKFMAGGADFQYNGGMRGLTIAVETEHASNTGTGLHVESCINHQYEDITIRNFTGGTGFKATWASPDLTNQYVQLWNFTVAGCNYNYDLDGFINCQGYGVYSTAAQTRDFLCRNAKLAMFGGNMQSSGPVCMELAGDGGNIIQVFGFYYEGFGPTVFKCSVPSVTSSRLEVYGFHCGASPDTLFDVDAFNDVYVVNVNRAGDADVILKARNGPSVTLFGCSDPNTSPAKFDLDATSKARLVCVGDLTVAPNIRASGRVQGDTSLALTSFATTLEPSSPLAGDLIRDQSLDRPSYRAASSWKRVAFNLDDNDLSSLLAPYAAEIFDPAAFRTLSIVSGGLDALVGILAGSTASAPSSGQRPVWNVRDDYFAGRPSFSCALSGNHLLMGTLVAPVVTASRPGLFAVYRCDPGTDDPANRRLAAYLEKASDHSSAIAIGQSDLNQSNHAYSFASGGAGFFFAIGAAGTDANGHAAVTYSGAGGLQYQRDAEALVSAGDPGATASAADHVVLGGAWNTLAYVGCDITVAYAAVLKAEPDTETVTKALRAAVSRYALR